MAFDDVLVHLGEFGRYQVRIYFLLCLPAISCAFHKLAGVFLQAKAKHRCLLPDSVEFPNATFTLPSEILNMSYPWDDKAKGWSSCQRLDANFSDTYFAGRQPANSSIACDRGWVYDRSEYNNSAVMELNLVCDNAYLRAFADSTFMVGVLLGSVIFGDLSDRFGRRPIFFISLVLQVTVGLVATALPEYFSFLVARMIIGATTSGVFLVAYVIAMEMVGPSKRLLAGVVCQFFFSFGYMLTAGFAYFVQDWRWLQAALSLPGLLFLSYWWFIPESARWLLTKGRNEEAKELLMKVAKENGTTVHQEQIDALLLSPSTSPSKEGEPQKPKPSIVDLIGHPNLRRKSFLIFFLWLVNSGTYYGLSWNSSSLGGNTYLTFLISGAVEFPAYGFLLLTLNRWGRKTILCGSMLLVGAALLLTIFVPTDKNWLIITLAMVGKLAITASYGTVYIFSAEQFPTVIRNVALGAASTSARIGGILAPQVNLLGEYGQAIPLIVFGALALTGGLLALLLPETLNKKLPDTIDEGENFGKKEEEEHEMHEVQQNGVSKDKKIAVISG